MLVFGILRSTSFSMDCSCIVPLTPVVVVIKGFRILAFVLYGVN